jgi:hypothetical protein
MKKNFLKLLVFIFIIFLKADAVSQTTVLVTTNNFIGFGWEIDQKPKDVTDPSTTKYVYIECDPLKVDNISLQRGSVFLSLPKKDDPTLVRVRLRNNLYDNTRLDEIEALSYRTYIEFNINKSAPVIALQIDIDNDSKQDYSIYFEPRHQPPHMVYGKLVPSQKVETGKWQEWDAFNVMK